MFCRPCRYHCSVALNHVWGTAGLLHTIIFNRALGPVKPQEVDSELFDITYARCGDPAVDAKVEEKISQFCAWIDRHPGKRGQVSRVGDHRGHNSSQVAAAAAAAPRTFKIDYYLLLVLTDSIHQVKIDSTCPQAVRLLR